MEIMLAKIFGLFLVIVAIGMFCNTQLFINAFDDIRQSAGIRVFSALFPILAGLVIIILHPVMMMNWTIAISVLGYGLLVLGTLRYWFISAYISFLTPLMGKTWIRVLGFLLLIWGSFLVIHGFPALMGLF